MKNIATHNQEAYDRLIAIKQFEKASGLQVPELKILSSLRSELLGKRILDLGVGGGRTTPFLLELSQNYVGVDYVGRMVRVCKGKFPDVRFEVGDAQNLSQFQDGEFDLVFFSFNGLDYLDHAGRLRVFSEVRRVLSERGIFIFSTHNRASNSTKSWSKKNLPPLIDALRRPAHFAFKLAKFPIGIYNSIKNKKMELVEAEYEMRNDQGSSYSLITYYIYIDDQFRQLEAAGFSSCEAVDLSGRWLASEERKESCDAWIYYLCRRSY